MPDQNDIIEQQKLLATQRKTLQHYLQQLAMAGVSHIRPEVMHGIDHARKQILHIKSSLRSWGVDVEDLPNDNDEEVSISSQLSIPNTPQELDAVKQRDDQIYAATIEAWVKQASLDNWEGWTSALLSSGQPHLNTDRNKEIEALIRWLMSRAWPKRYPQLEAAFKNFQRVLQDLYSTFHQYARDEYGTLWTEKIYRRGYGDHELTDQLFREYDFHVRLVQDLTLELTRAANYMCDQIRQYIDPLFRVTEGVLLTMSGPHSDFNWHQYRPEYRGEERMLFPYPGLSEFKRVRINRDCCFGKGINADDPEARIEDDDE